MADRPIVVVVDDSKPFLMYLSLLLNRMNLEVLPVSNAVEALEVTRVTRPHLMTIDMIMPEMDGLETLRAIREDAELSDMPVIMISSYADKSKQWEALSLGCLDVLDKPVELRRLHKAIQSCDFYPGGRRKYLRTPFEESVEIYHKEKKLKAASATLSERGIFLHMREQLAKGEHVDVELPLSSGGNLKVGGTVIYGKAQNGGGSVISQGVAVKFDRMTAKDGEVVSGLVTELLIGDIVAEQPEPVVKAE
jgi:CheY-like chemotaxis protein